MPNQHHMASKPRKTRRASRIKCARRSLDSSLEGWKCGMDPQSFMLRSQQAAPDGLMMKLVSTWIYNAIKDLYQCHILKLTGIEQDLSLAVGCRLPSNIWDKSTTEKRRTWNNLSKFVKKERINYLHSLPVQERSSAAVSEYLFSDYTETPPPGKLYKCTHSWCLYLFWLWDAERSRKIHQVAILDKPQQQPEEKVEAKMPETRRASQGL